MLPMLAPKSYTAEDVVELHTHGGGVCAKAVLHRCIQLGARLAKPGEFTLRAFLNGRMDLSQVGLQPCGLGAGIHDIWTTRVYTSNQASD